MISVTAAVLLMFLCFLLSVNMMLVSRRNNHLKKGHVAVLPSTSPSPTTPLHVEAVATPTSTSSSHPVGERASGNSVRARSVDDLKTFGFVRLQEVSSRQWLSRAIDTNIEQSLPHEKIFLFYFVRHYQAWAVQGHTRMHLTCELNDRVTVDRKWARSFEMWYPTFDSDGHLILKSRRNGKYLRVAGSDQLIADTADAHRAARFIAELVEPNGGSASSTARCRGIGKGEADAAVPRKVQVVMAADRCWGNLTNTDSVSQPQALDGRSKRLPTPPFVLFGSPKPLEKLAAQNPNDPFDTFLISRRTLQNWAALPSMLPFILADDKGNQQLIETLNREGSQAGPNVHSIDLQTDQFERKERFKNQPTYRGLFDAALKRHPDAPAVMYSNSDILYHPSLAETISAVVEYVEAERLRKTRPGMPPYKVKGWMIVGQRVNHDVPSTWEVSEARNPHWATNLTSFAKVGDLFESDAEDYFIVSRSLFDWMHEIPDFIVGGVAFDNWITNRVNKMAEVGEAICIDAGKTIVAVHQNHGGDPKQSHQTPKSYYNSHLAVQHGGWTLGHTADAAYATDRRSDGAIAVYDKHRLLYG